MTWNVSNATTASISPGIGAVPLTGSQQVSPTATTTYVLTASGADGSATANVTITVTAPVPQPTPAPTVKLSANPTTVTAGQFSTLTWTTTNTTSVSLTPTVPAEDSQPLPVSGSTTVVPKSTTTYTMTATGPGGTASASVAITVNQPAPTITFTATPDSIIAGQKSTLSWTTTNTTSLTIDNNIGTVDAASGTKDVTPAATTTYTATATGPGGTTTAKVTVTVQQQLAVTLTAKPTSITSGQSSTLTWTSQGATSVAIDQGIGNVSLQGSQDVKPTQTTTYTATAKDASGNSKTATATVTVMTNAGNLSTLKHIIFILQENRSFDNYFSQLGGYRQGKGLPNEIDAMDLNTVQLDQQGVGVLPYHQTTQCVENTSPSWNPSWGSYNNGAMDGFVRVRDDITPTDPWYHRAMGYYDQRDLPYYYELATQFATSDRFFGSVMAGTIPNRMYSFTGTSFGHIFPDPPPSGGWQQKTIFDLMNENGVNWRYYYMDNSIFLGQFSSWNNPAIQSRIFNISNFYDILSRPTADEDLPPVIYIERGSDTGLDEHPGANIQPGIKVVQQILAALMNSAAWKSSVFILSYDEAGGLYDHVPPQVVPAPDDIQPIASPQFEKPLPGDFAHTGFRIPLIVVSPWVKRGFVSHKTRDLTSIMKLIEARFGLPSLTRRDAWADDMAEFFDFSAPNTTVPALPSQPTNTVCDFSKELDGQRLQ